METASSSLRSVAGAPPPGPGQVPTPCPPPLLGGGQNPIRPSGAFSPTTGCGARASRAPDAVTRAPPRPDAEWARPVRARAAAPQLTPAPPRGWTDLRRAHPCSPSPSSLPSPRGVSAEPVHWALQGAHGTLLEGASGPQNPVSTAAPPGSAPSPFPGLFLVPRPCLPGSGSMGLPGHPQVALASGFCSRSLCLDYSSSLRAVRSAIRAVLAQITQPPLIPTHSLFL